VRLAALLFWLVPSVALAHGRPTEVQRIVFDPNDPDRIVLQTTFGLVVSSDAGVSWNWICAASFGADATREEPDVAIVEDGSIVLATFDGIAIVAPDLCTSSHPPGPASDAYVVDLDPRRDDAAIVWGVVSSGVDPDVVVRSDDSGATWNVVGAPIEDVLLERIVLAPSDPDRIYATGAIPETAETPRTLVLLGSIDGAQTFTTRSEIASLEGERFPHVVAVHPTNPERVFVRMERSAIDTRPERILVSDDGGETFEPLFELPNARAFEISADGQTMWIGSSTDGLWIARDGATMFEQVSTLHVLCAEERGTELWLCLDQRVDGFGIGRSSDGGTNVEEVLRLDDVTALPTCDTCDTTQIVCPAWTFDLLADYELYFGSGDAGMTGLPRDAAIPTQCLPDGGAPPPPPMESCGCRAAQRPSPYACLFMLAVLYGAKGSLKRGSSRNVRSVRLRKSSITSSRS
jgi:hypothetical protein